MEIYLYQKPSLVGCIDLKGFFCCGYDSCVTHVRRYFYLIGRKTMPHPKIKYCHWIDSPYTLNQGKFLCTDRFPLSFYFDISCCFVDIQKEINAVKL